VGTTALTLFGVTALAGGTWCLWPLERGATSAPATPCQRVEIVEDTRPVLEGRRSSDVTGRREGAGGRAAKTPSESAPPRTTWFHSAGAAAAESTEEPQTEDDAEAPPDPLARGTSCLVVRVTSEDTGDPVAVDLQLWRVHAPGNAAWTQGDQLQATSHANSGAAMFEGLPEGTYRLSSGDARRGTNDPPAFEVRGDVTEVSVSLPLPRPFGVWLRVVDGEGTLVRRGLCGSARNGSTRETLYEPDWIASRTRRDVADGAFVGPRSGGLVCSFSCCGGPAAATPCEAVDARGFWFGDNLERARAHWAFTDHVFRAGDSSVVEWDVDDEERRDRTYLGVVVPIDVLVARVTLPNGMPLTRAESRVHADCEAILVGEDTPEDAWRTLPIRVWVHVDGHDALRFEASAKDPSPRWALTRPTASSLAPSR
jgi:hypothetical protein